MTPEGRGSLPMVPATTDRPSSWTALDRLASSSSRFSNLGAGRRGQSRGGRRPSGAVPLTARTLAVPTLGQEPR